MLLRILIALLFTVIFQPKVAAQSPFPPCPNPIKYENYNQITLPPLSLRDLSGRAVAQDGVPVSGICIGLFTEQDQHLVASSIADDEGYFRFRNIPTGVYRLVANK